MQKKYQKCTCEYNYNPLTSQNSSPISISLYQGKFSILQVPERMNEHPNILTIQQIVDKKPFI